MGFESLDIAGCMVAKRNSVTRESSKARMAGRWLLSGINQPVELVVRWFRLRDLWDWVRFELLTYLLLTNELACFKMEYNRPWPLLCSAAKRKPFAVE